MAYIGRNPAIGTQKVLDSLESQFDGALTTFDLRYSTNTIYPTLASALIVSLGGVLQEPGSAYNVASDQITFATAPGAGTDCWILLYSEFGGVAGATTNLTIGNNLTVQGDTDLDGDIDIDAGQITYTASSNIAKFADDAKLIFGEGDDLQIYHDGSNSYIDDAGTGNLIIGAANFQLMNVAHSENHITATDNAQVELFHNGTKKFETTSTGATITGTALATALSTGASGTGINISTDTISGPATLTIDPAAVGDNTGTVIIAGDFQVDGTTTTINSTTLTVDDKNIVLASGAANSAAADGAGVTVDGAAATLLYKSTPDAWVFNKNVGIGTDSPAKRVEIFDTAATVLQLNSTSSDGTSLRIQNSGTDKMYMGLAGDFITGQANNVTDSAIRASGSLLFASGGGTERLRITSGGNVGIGEDSPDVRLHVKEQFDTAYSLANVADEANHLLKLENPSTTANAFSGMQFRVGSGADLFFGAIQQTTNHGDFFFANQNSPQKEMMRIKSTGNVGIGTNDPAALLHLESTAANAARLRIGFDSPRYYDIFRGSTTNSGYLNFYASQTGFTGYIFDGVDGERLRITFDGAINIGKGDESSSSANLVEMYVGATDESYGTIRGKYNRTNEYNRSEVRFGVEENANGKGFLAFATGTNSATERLRIDSDGHVTPGADNTQDFGSASKRWRNIYTGDLQLSNEGSSNEVDGTWGNYTIQEGEEELFIINRRSGKKFKFVLEEVK